MDKQIHLVSKSDSQANAILFIYLFQWHSISKLFKDLTHLTLEFLLLVLHISLHLVGYRLM